MTLALSGISKMEQVIENDAIAEHSQPHNLTASEIAFFGQFRDAYLSLSPLSCTVCRYCMPCPNSVDIPRVFEFYNEAVIYGDVERRRRMYGDPNMIKDESAPISALSANNA